MHSHHSCSSHYFHTHWCLHEKQHTLNVNHSAAGQSQSKSYHCSSFHSHPADSLTNKYKRNSQWCYCTSVHILHYWWHTHWHLEVRTHTTIKLCVELYSVQTISPYLTWKWNAGLQVNAWWHYNCQIDFTYCSAHPQCNCEPHPHNVTVSAPHTHNVSLWVSLTSV